MIGDPIAHERLPRILPNRTAQRWTLEEREIEGEEMIVRTPPPQRKRRAEGSLDEVGDDVNDRRLVVYDDTMPLSSLDHRHDDGSGGDMACTYHCHQMVKSEFMDAYDNAQKQIIDYQSRLNTLTNDLQKNEVDNKSFQDKLHYLEQELAASKAREMALEERLLNEVDDSRMNFESQVKRNSELEIQLKREAELRRNAEVSAAAAKDNSIRLEQKIIQLSESSEREKNRLLRELTISQDEEKLSCSRLNRELERMRARADCTLEESELQQKQLDELRGQLNEVLADKKVLEQKISGYIERTHIGAPYEDEALVKHLQDELRNYENELQELRKLRSWHENIGLMEEKLLAEKAHRERAEEQVLHFQKIELDANRMKDELAALNAVVNNIPGISSFDQIPKKVAALQQEAIESMKEVSEIKERTKGLAMALELANLSKKQSETEYMLAKEKVEALVSEIDQLKLMLTAVTAERDLFKGNVFAYNNNQNMDKDDHVVIESLAKKMEAALAEKDRCIIELGANLEEQRVAINHKHEELRLANEKLNIETKRAKSLERECDRLRSEIALLESKLGHGDYSSENTKVLRMVNTLSVDNEVKQTIETLSAELQKTRAKLQAVEELNGRSDAGNLLEADVSEKLAILKGQIATLEKREERYKMVFADKISVFRRACCSLFGYKIIMEDQQRPNGIPITHFTLQSIYAQCDEEKLEFEYESGNINILVNDYTSQPEISHQVDIFVKKFNSVPAFTANLTVESFNKRTLN